MPINLSRKTKMPKVSVEFLYSTSVKIRFWYCLVSDEVRKELESLPDKCDLFVRIRDFDNKTSLKTEVLIKTKDKEYLPIKKAAQEIVRYLIEDCGLNVEYDQEMRKEGEVK